MKSKREQKDKVAISLLMYSTDEVERIVLDAIKECALEDSKDHENGDTFALITMSAGAKILLKVKDILKEKEDA